MHNEEAETERRVPERKDGTTKGIVLLYSPDDGVPIIHDDTGAFRSRRVRLLAPVVVPEDESGDLGTLFYGQVVDPRRTQHHSRLAFCAERHKGHIPFRKFFLRQLLSHLKLPKRSR